MRRSDLAEKVLVDLLLFAIRLNYGVESGEKSFHLEVDRYCHKEFVDGD